jgi:predicted dehydrogenase
MDPLSRREFAQQTVGVTAVAATFGARKAVSANEKVVVGVMGVGGRGTDLALRFAARSDVNVAYLCDVDTRRIARAKEAVENAQGRPVKTVQDFRRILEDRDVNALINATPDHWHVLGGVMACQAGKDVYVEKPMAHNIWEGRKMIEAARKYKRVVQVGTQSRSAPYVTEAINFIRSGGLGEVHLVRVFNMMQHPLMKQSPDQPPPAELDYDMWCGPAAKLPYNPTSFWLNMWEYSCGPIAGDAVHQLDLARYLMGDPPYPKTVSGIGDLTVLRDGRDTPDTQYAMFEYDKFNLIFESALWMPYMQKMSQEVRNGDVFPDWPFCSEKVEVLGTAGIMYFGRHGGGWQVFDNDKKLIKQCHGRPGDNPHIENFIQCIRSRSTPAADAEQGHYSGVLCHAANISWRLGNKKLRLDGKTDTFVGEPEANRLIKRNYRKPWIFPEQV